jgi:tetratricopeptide (TPR) repeat protein
MFFLLVLVGLSGAMLYCPAAESDDKLKTTGSQWSIEDLIERLGSPSYATRIRARESLQQLGLEAFDSLHEAQFHADSEIAMTARHLVSSLMISWSKETDPESVRQALQDYGSQSETERSSRMEMLAVLPDRQGLEALVRLARFETNLRLSREAALLLMQQPMSEDESRRRRESEIVLSGLGINERQAAKWLRVYARDLAAGSYSADTWRTLIADQRREVESGATMQASRATVLELTRVCAARAAKLDQHSEALRLVTEQMDLIPPTSRDLVDACSWAIDHGFHAFVIELRQRHPRLFEQQPVLLYGAAEAYSQLQDSVQAETLAAAALAIHPLPKSEEERSKQSPKDLEDIAQAHREIGQELTQRGLFQWAEREFRRITDSLEINNIPAVHAREHLSSMYAELQRHQDVVEILEPLLARVENDDQFANRLNTINFRLSKETLRSLIDYHKGLDSIASGRTEAAKPLLQRAFAADEDNIDILIAMYRLEGDAEWSKFVQEQVQRHTRLAFIRVQQEESMMQKFARPDGKEAYANTLNTYAWLVSNTTGDYAQALEFSKKSLELLPDDWRLADTCGRCYFAIGDLENAVRTQRRAVKMMPHSPPLVRQLEEFEAALAAKQKSNPDPTQP